jgi:hypothetical protein
MQRKRFIALVVVAVMLGTVAVMAQGSKPEATQKWQYETRFYWEWTSKDGLSPEMQRDLVHIRDMNVSLNKLGSTGYEVISVSSFLGSPGGQDPYRRLNHTIVVLKRRA